MSGVETLHCFDCGLRLPVDAMPECDGCGLRFCARCCRAREGKPPRCDGCDIEQQSRSEKRGDESMESYVWRCWKDAMGFDS